jgi:Wzt C-terminal domain
LREWGTGEAVIASARLLGVEGEEREQFLAGEPLSLAVEIEAREPVEAPLLQLELRDDSGLLIASDVAETAELGWNGAGRLAATMTVPALPLAFGRFHLRLGLTDASGEHLLHWLDDALVFLVYSDSEERGLVRLGGAWHAGANSGSR